MPGYDNTGPQGAGPKTGRGLGTCEGDKTRRVNQGFGRMRRLFRRSDIKLNETD